MRRVLWTARDSSSTLAGILALPQSQRVLSISIVRLEAASIRAVYVVAA